MEFPRSASALALLLAVLTAPNGAVGQSSADPSPTDDQNAPPAEESTGSQRDADDEDGSDAAGDDGTDRSETEGEDGDESNGSRPSSSEDGESTDGERPARTDDEGGEVSETSNVRSTDESGDGSEAASESYEDLTARERLRRAERAFGQGDFGQIPPLLEPLLGDDPAFDAREHLIRARELLGVGFFFEAQQTTDPSRRDELMDQARTQFLELLRVRPDYDLDSLIFPASVVDLFETVRDAHADELDTIRQQRRQSSTGDGSGRGGQTNTVYVERNVETRTYALNFFPFGVGQFQNDDLVRGLMFGSGQLAAVAFQGVATWRIESMRRPNGRFCNPEEEPGCDDLAVARNLRTAQWIVGGVGVGLYVASAIDAVLNYEPTADVQIRMRDEPPPELSSSDSSAGNGPTVQIGFGSVTIRW